MSTARERFLEVDRLFREVCALPPEQVEAALSASSADESIRDQVRAMLRIDLSDPGVLDVPAYGVALSDDDFDPSGESATPPALPEFIGHYRIVRVLGEGGMGIVFEAEQERPRRRVALKVLRRQWGSEHPLRRFRQESEILGRLQHPGIAQILEAGSTDDDDGARPFIAMEYVQGRPLLAYANDERLSRRDRLNLLALVCDAVHYAHQNGVVHRDLKPANILVVHATTQGPGTKSGTYTFQPKILDFGVSRLRDPEAQTLTLQTTAGELIGTVPYMSPEQAAGDPEKLDWRSDVYSLGVILYELLTDRLPQEVRGMMVHEAVRAIQQDEPTPAGSIDRSLRGDVETILAKALEKDRQRRYQSAADLASDIRRHLDQQPIAARRASAAYRVRKFAKRNKALVTGVSIAFIAMGVATGVSVRQAIVAERSRQQEVELRSLADSRAAEAERAREQSEAAYQFLAEMIGAADADEMGKDVRVSEFLVHAASKIDERFPDQPRVRAHLRRNIGITYRSMGMLNEAETLLLQAVEDAKLAYDEDDPILLRALRSAAVLYDDQGLYDKSLPMHKQILAVQIRTLGPEHRDTLGSACNVGLTLFDLGRFEEAGEMLESTAASMRKTLGVEDRFTINAIQGVGSVRLRQGRLDEAEAAFTEARDVSSEAYGLGDFRAITAVDSLAKVELARGHPDDALAFCNDSLERAQSVMPSSHWRIGQIQHLRARCLLELAQFDEAQRLLLDARGIFEAAFGDDAGPMTDEIQATLDRLEDARMRANSR